MKGRRYPLGIQTFKNIIEGNYVYVDKTDLIYELVHEKKYCFLSRPRRFGKSLLVTTLQAYFEGKKELFKGLKLEALEKDWEKHPVIHLDLSKGKYYNMESLIETLDKILETYEDLYQITSVSTEAFNVRLIRIINAAKQKTGRNVVVLIDEYDVPLQAAYQNNYYEEMVDFLRSVFSSALKTNDALEKGVMTGCLRISKESIFTGLNNISSESFGFTELEVKQLLKDYNLSEKMDEVKEWYDGYSFASVHSVYSPRSVIEAVLSGICDSYWNQTETFEALKIYIDMNFDGLKDDVLSMMVGERVAINTGGFTNDMVTFHSKDDVLTLLIHLGYLAYDFEDKCVYIPNNEVRGEYVNAVSVSEWGEVSEALRNSAWTLRSIWERRPEQVSKGIEQAHFETSHLQYNDENALSYTISLALYAARNFYQIYRELPTGKGFADLVFIPRKKFPDKPALIVELKWDKTAKGAINQIKNKQYFESLQEYQGNLLLVGVNYDKDTREHQCEIEEFYK